MEERSSDCDSSAQTTVLAKPKIKLKGKRVFHGLGLICTLPLPTAVPLVGEALPGGRDGVVWMWLQREGRNNKEEEEVVFSLGLEIDCALQHQNFITLGQESNLEPTHLNLIQC